MTKEPDMKIARILTAVAAAAALLCAPAASADDEDVNWIADKNGCKIANPFPQPKETVTWSGGCKNGLADGEGVMQWFIDGKPLDRYEGSVQEGWAEGKGTLEREGGRYAGEWKRSMQNGVGRYDAPDGSWYEGQWKDGKPHGQGQYQTPDGRLFTGEWVDGEFEGDLEQDEDDGNPNRT
jgi:hypothetical protein